MSTCKTVGFGNKPLCLCFCLFRNYLGVSKLDFLLILLLVLLTRLCVYVNVVVEGMYICNTGNFVNKLFCLCFCCCIGYLYM